MIFCVRFKRESIARRQGHGNPSSKGAITWLDQVSFELLAKPSNCSVPPSKIKTSSPVRGKTFRSFWQRFVACEKLANEHLHDRLRLCEVTSEWFIRAVPSSTMWHAAREG
jgi:hypothetical protein